MSCETVPSTQSVDERRRAETLEIGKHEKSKPRTTTIENGERQKTFKKQERHTFLATSVLVAALSLLDAEQRPRHRFSQDRVVYPIGCPLSV